MDMAATRVQELIDQTNALPPDEKKQVQAGIGGPGQKVRDRIWQWVVGAFLLILLAVVATLIAAFLIRNSLSGAEVLTAIFTAALGFVAGLFAPSPAQG
jgi:hypothetical protein